MAESTRAPSLPSTSDATPYVPVSWPAAAAAAVAAVFAFTLLFLGAWAFKDRKPLIEPVILALPIIAIVLCFAARRMIQNSEGTRTGILYGVNLVNSAWWLSLVLGLCYVAYLFAIDYAIRNDARAETEKWFRYINKGDDNNVTRAFFMTLPPLTRQGFSLDEPGRLRGAYRDPILMFTNSDLVKLAQRNKDELQLTPGTVAWSYKPGAIESVLNGTVTCPEGNFPIVVPLKGIDGVTNQEGGGTRSWMIDTSRGYSFIDQSRATRTAYGWMVAALEDSGSRTGKEFILNNLSGPTTHPYLYRAFVDENDREAWSEVARSPLLQLAFAAPAGITGGKGYLDYMENRFYRLPGGGEPTPDKKLQFFQSWNALGVRPAGEKLKGPDGGPIDREMLIEIADAAVVVRVPVEIPIPGKHEVARGRVVVECKDPSVLAEVKQLKASADPKQGTRAPSDALTKRAFHWRVVAVESDMAGINLAPTRGPGGPGGPGGGPPSAQQPKQ